MDVAFPSWDARRRRDVDDAVEALNNTSMFTSDGMEVFIEIGVAKNQEKEGVQNIHTHTI